jgi:MoxR-like ATPase
MLKIKMGYPTKADEKSILERMTAPKPPAPNKVTDPKTIVRARQIVSEIYVDEKIKNYIVDLVFATREPANSKMAAQKNLISWGASPRATLALAQAAKAYAFLNGRGYVTPEDVKSIGADVLRHRIIVSYEAEAESITSENIIQSLFEAVEVP